MDWYENIEPEVREVVRALRNNGINTECSCGHEMYIQCQSCDPETELRTIYNVLSNMQYENYEVVIRRKVMGGHCYNSLDIKLPKESK